MLGASNADIHRYRWSAAVYIYLCDRYTSCVIILLITIPNTMILLYSLYELLRELTRILDLRTTHKISTPIALVLSDWTPSPRTTFLLLPPLRLLRPILSGVTLSSWIELPHIWTCSTVDLLLGVLPRDLLTGLLVSEHSRLRWEGWCDWSGGMGWSPVKRGSGRAGRFEVPLVRLQRHRTELICKVARGRGHLLRLSGKITHI